MTRKQGILALVFLLFLAASLWTAGSIVGMPKTDEVLQISRRFVDLHTDEKDTWDGVFLGTSLAGRGWAAPLAWEEHGMAVYCMATHGQPFMLTVSLLEEVLRYQDVDFVIVELHGTRPATLKTNESRVRKVTEHMSLSPTRFKAIKNALEHMDQWYPGYYDESFINRLSFYIPFLKYHKRVTSDRFYLGDIYEGKSELKGAYEEARRVMATPLTVEPTKLSTPLGEEAKELLDELFAFCKEKELQLVFVNAPDAMSDEVKGYVNGAVDYVKENGYQVLNFYDSEVLEESGISGQEDFTDKKHLNTAGAYKFTQYVSSWLKERLEIEDHRGDEKYESWDDAADAYQIFYEETLEEIEIWKEKNLKGRS